MKKLEIIVRPEELEDLKGILKGCQADDIVIGNIMGCRNQKSYTQMCHGTTYTVNPLPKMRVETVAPEDIVETIIDEVVREITTGNYDDGKVFVYDVQDTIRTCIGEKGVEAL